MDFSVSHGKRQDSKKLAAPHLEPQVQLLHEVKDQSIRSVWLLLCCHEELSNYTTSSIDERIYISEALALGGEHHASGPTP